MLPLIKKNEIHAVNVVHELFKLAKPSYNMQQQLKFPADIDFVTFGMVKNWLNRHTICNNS